jgi:DNA-binding transcriptional LysR family regulator
MVARTGLADVRLLVEVSRRGSFTAVARGRGIDPSSVSRAVAALERELGVRLFERTTRALAPTEAGRLYLARVAPLLEEFDRASDEARSARADPVGALRLTASVAFGQVCLVPLLPAFRGAFPRLGLELLLTDANLDLVADRVDLAVRLAPSFRADVIGTKLFPTRYRVCASPRTSPAMARRARRRTSSGTAACCSRCRSSGRAGCSGATAPSPKSRSGGASWSRPPWRCATPRWRGWIPRCWPIGRSPTSWSGNGSSTSCRDTT